IGIEGISFLGDPKYTLGTVIAVTIWLQMGYYMIIFLAGLQDIPGELYEAARIDGAGAWARFRRITLPLLAPTSFFVLLTSMVAVVTGGLDMIFVLTSGGPANSTSLLIFYIYQQAFLFGDLGYAAAVGSVLVAFLLLISAVMFLVTRGGRFSRDACRPPLPRRTPPGARRARRRPLRPAPSPPAARRPPLAAAGHRRPPGRADRLPPGLDDPGIGEDPGGGQLARADPLHGHVRELRVRLLQRPLRPLSAQQLRRLGRGHGDLAVVPLHGRLRPGPPGLPRAGADLPADLLDDAGQRAGDDHPDVHHRAHTGDGRQLRG